MAMATLGQWRRAMAAGILFVVLFVVGVLVSFANSPEIKKKDDAASAAAKYVRFLSDSSNRTGIVIGAYVLIVAAAAFVWFANGLRELLGSNAVEGRLVSGLGALGASAVAAGAIINATVAGSISFGNEPVPAGDTIRVLMDTFFPFLFVVFALISALLIAIVCVSLMRTRAMPGWIAYTGWLGVIGGLLAVIFLPVVLTLLWFLAVAVTGLVRPPAFVAGLAVAPEPPGSASA
jgi:hypothetical protein